MNSMNDGDPRQDSGGHRRLPRQGMRAPNPIRRFNRAKLPSILVSVGRIVSFRALGFTISRSFQRSVNLTAPNHGRKFVQPRSMSSIDGLGAGAPRRKRSSPRREPPGISSLAIVSSRPCHRAIGACGERTMPEDRPRAKARGMSRSFVRGSPPLSQIGPHHVRRRIRGFVGSRLPHWAGFRAMRVVERGTDQIVHPRVDDYERSCSPPYLT